MIQEPTQDGRFVRHPCNAYSNVLYVTCGLVALSLAKKEKDKDKENGASYIWIPDTMFGVGLFLLAFVSFMWHASNVAWIHYVDLATMETVIVYVQHSHKRSDATKTLPCFILKTKTKNKKQKLKR